MLEPLTPGLGPVDALEVGSRLSELEMERGLALGTALGGVRSYMADLDEELEHCRALYAMAVVAEIATLRAELFGPQTGCAAEPGLWRMWHRGARGSPWSA